MTVKKKNCQIGLLEGKDSILLKGFDWIPNSFHDVLLKITSFASGKLRVLCCIFDHIFFYNLISYSFCRSTTSCLVCLNFQFLEVLVAQFLSIFTIRHSFTCKH